MRDSKKGRKPLVAERRFGAKPQKPPAKRKRPVRKVASGNILTRILRWVFRLIWKITWRVTVAALSVLALFVGYYWTTLPEVTALLDGRARGSVTMLDRDEQIFARRGDQFGGAVTAQSVSPALRQAVVATEDKRFYRHFGLSPRGIASAVRINLSEGRGPLSGHGGSTITQQTAKLLCLGEEYVPSEWKDEAAYVADCRRTSIQRKAKEAIYALAMEAKYSKDEILSIYLNRAYMGGGAYGAEAAAQRYFGVPADDLNPSQAAMIAGLLTAPSRLAPTSDLQRSHDRAATILRLMGEQGYLSDAEVAQWQNAPSGLAPAARQNAGGYFADWVMSTGPEFFTRNTVEDVVIRTTLDQRLQRAAEDAVNVVFDTKVREGSKAQAAVVVMSADGAVRAMVGGRETRASGVFNRAIQAERQTGSAFKPFIYAAALELGYSPLDTVEDAPMTIDIPGSGPWSPRNYTNDYKGRVTLTQALQDSLNIPAVKVSEFVGRDLVRRVASDFGIDSDLADGPALALGASESTLLDMTGAYAGILNGGSSVTPYGLVDLRLKGDAEPLMGTGGGIRERVIRDEAAAQLIWMMQQVVSEGTGQRAQFGGREIAGKTGTTQAARDAWFVGFTADYVAGVWMGYDDNTPLTGVTGGGLPAEIWRETMARVHDGVPVRPLPMQAPVGVQPQPQAPQPAQPQQREREVPRTTEGLIEMLVREILGGNR
ncbi:MAG: PBP1A family penicillin-binding protein [Pseudomonadota bacterium]